MDNYEIATNHILNQIPPQVRQVQSQQIHQLQHQLPNQQQLQPHQPQTHQILQSQDAMLPSTTKAYGASISSFDSVQQQQSQQEHRAQQDQQQEQAKLQQQQHHHHQDVSDLVQDTHIQYRQQATSPKVTVSLPKYAASRLLDLVQRRDIALIRLGIISVQFENDQTIPLGSSTINSIPNQINQSTKKNAPTVVSEMQINGRQKVAGSTILQTTVDAVCKPPTLESYEMLQDSASMNANIAAKPSESSVAIIAHSETHSTDTETAMTTTTATMTNNTTCSTFTPQFRIVQPVSRTQLTHITSTETSTETVVIQEDITSTESPSDNASTTSLPVVTRSPQQSTNEPLRTEIKKERNKNDLAVVYDDDEEDDDKDEEDVVSEVENQHNSFNIHQLSQLEFSDNIELEMYDSDNLLFPDYTLNLS